MTSLWIRRPAGATNTGWYTTSEQGPKMEDVLINWKITGHYRYFGRTVPNDSIKVLWRVTFSNSVETVAP